MRFLDFIVDFWEVGVGSSKKYSGLRLEENYAHRIQAVTLYDTFLPLTLQTKQDV